MSDKPFHELYEEWMWPPPRKKRIEDELRSRYRDAWNHGSSQDRNAVLYFLMLTNEATGADVMVDALRTAGPKMASAAGANAVSMVIQGHDLGPDARDAFVVYGKRHPKWSTFAAVALEILDKKAKRDRALISQLAASARAQHRRVSATYGELANELAATYTNADPDGARFVVKIDGRAKLIRTYRVFDVVKAVTDEYREKTLRDARKLRADAARGEQVLFGGAPSFRGRMAGETVKARFLSSLA